MLPCCGYLNMEAISLRRDFSEIPRFSAVCQKQSFLLFRITHFARELAALFVCSRKRRDEYMHARMLVVWSESEDTQSRYIGVQQTERIYAAAAASLLRAYPAGARWQSDAIVCVWITKKRRHTVRVQLPECGVIVRATSRVAVHHEQYLVLVLLLCKYVSC